jgi:hypothetical protein
LTNDFPTRRRRRRRRRRRTTTKQNLDPHCTYVPTQVKNVKTKCQFKKWLGGKKEVKFNVKKLHFRRVQTKSEYIKHLEDEKSSSYVGHFCR